MPAAATTRAEGVRARARREMRDAILDTARTHLAEAGAANLSLRAVARDVGMVSSALYRYFDSRDALLTALIVDAYNSLGEAVEGAEAAVDRADLAGRWLAIARSTRTWAQANPHLYALVYGSPVPGYAAPQDTIGPASRVTRLLSDLMADIAADPASDERPLGAVAAPGPDVLASVAPAWEFVGHQVPADLLLRGLMAWTYLFGAISFELFGQRNNVVTDDGRDAFFDAEVDRVAALLGLAATGRGPGAVG